MGVFANSSMEKGYEGQIVVKSSNLLIPKSLKKKKKKSSILSLKLQFIGVQILKFNIFKMFASVHSENSIGLSLHDVDFSYQLNLSRLFLNQR